MSLYPLDVILRRLVTYGRLAVEDADGRSMVFGKADAQPFVKIRFRDDSVKRRLIARPALAVGEAYTKGDFVITEGSLRDLLDILLIANDRAHPKGVAGNVIRHAKELYRMAGVVNPVKRAKRNIQHHYDLQESFYRLFLDEDMQYSCAYFREPDMTLEEAQIEKKRHIARKLLLEPGMEVLDIGSGWGGLGLFLAREYGVRVTGVTLSEDQFAVSNRRAREAGLSDRVTFKLLDYRLEKKVYDRIVSVGMFEHVGEPHFRQFFHHLKRLLHDDGVAVLHTIGRMTPPEPISVWIQKYIFPGAYLPTVSQLSPIFEKDGLMLTDLENWRLHYATTLRHWDERVRAHASDIKRMVDDRVFGSRFFGDPTTGEEFLRGWEFYLLGCEAGFRHEGLCVFQFQLAKRIETVPLTRDYMYVDKGSGLRLAPRTGGVGSVEAAE